MELVMPRACPVYTSAWPQALVPAPVLAELVGRVYTNAHIWGWGMGSVQIEEHNGQRVVVSDCRNCTPQEIIDVCDQVQEIVTAQPPHSIHTLTDFTGAKFDKNSIQRLKEAAAFDRPHILRAAFVGVDTLPDAYHKAVQNFSARQFAIFKTREEALAYLTQDTANEQTA